MKFTWKLVISVTAIISVIFSAAALILISRNFRHSMEAVTNQNLEAHLLERYGIESHIMETISDNGEISAEKLTAYAKAMISYFGNNRRFAIYFDQECIYSNVEISQTDLNELLQGARIHYLLREYHSKNYMLAASSLEINNRRITVASSYDITHVFEEKDRQMVDFYKLDAVVIVVSALAIWILAVFLTRPIVRLNEMSSKIAQGQYSGRIRQTSQDEIGELTQSFNSMADTIEHKIEELELSVRQREEFISNFTHELKSPMTSIIGYADLLRSNKYGEQIKVKSAEYIFQEAKRLEVLSHKLMDLMGLSAEHIELERLNAVQFFQEIVNYRKERPQGVEVVLDIEEGTFMADPYLLEDCIRNLLDNAEKSEPRDHKILLCTNVQGPRYQITIQDHGCGISESDLPRITESFYMADKARARAGGRSGIGLAICEKIVRLHGSELHFESQLGVGTTVTFDLEMNLDLEVNLHES
ncbi:MAG: HAMP domain-containing histidine kinase [Lachnospiraceae bacterium]|nr:HAMP domain-containing histidine kinase [Lachnospiraceae bacterium]